MGALKRKLGTKFEEIEEADDIRGRSWRKPIDCSFWLIGRKDDSQVSTKAASNRKAIWREYKQIMKIEQDNCVVMRVGLLTQAGSHFTSAHKSWKQIYRGRERERENNEKVADREIIRTAGNIDR